MIGSGFGSAGLGTGSILGLPGFIGLGLLPGSCGSPGIPGSPGITGVPLPGSPGMMPGLGTGSIPTGASGFVTSVVSPATTGVIVIVPSSAFVTTADFETSACANVAIIAKAINSANFLMFFLL